jgi:hypothetical protein
MPSPLIGDEPKKERSNEAAPWALSAKQGFKKIAALKMLREP